MHASSVPSTFRFVLKERFFKSGEGISYWRARESRGGREVVVRVIDAPTATHPRWLEQLQRERALGERLQSPCVLRTQVPPVEGACIVQAVEPMPARLLRFDGTQRMSALRAALRIAETLAHCHALGHAHGTLASSSLLATSSGEPLICGFGMAGGSAHDLQQHAARDVLDLVDRVSEMLAASGGPPARLRRVLETGQPLRSMDPMSAMAWLRDELREAMEDTFPWPVIAQQPRPLSREDLAPSAAPREAPVTAPESLPPPEALPQAERQPQPDRTAKRPGTPAPSAPGPTRAPSPRTSSPRQPPAAPAFRDGQRPARPAWRRALMAVMALGGLTLVAYFLVPGANPPTTAPSTMPADPVAIGPSSPVELERAVAAALADAEARLQAGEPDIAHAWFEHALSLDPANERALAGLQRAATAVDAQRPGPLARLLRSLGLSVP